MNKKENKLMEFDVTFEGEFSKLDSFLEELMQDILKDLPKHTAIKAKLNINTDNKNIITEYTLDTERSELLKAEAPWFTKFYLLHGINVKGEIKSDDKISAKISIMEV